MDIQETTASVTGDMWHDLSHTFNDAIQPFAHWPELHDPLFSGGIAVAAAGAIATYSVLRHKHSKDKMAVEVRNPDLIKTLYDGKKNSTLRRIGSSILMATGMVGLAASLYSHPTYSTSEANSSTNTIIVLDGTNSMAYTEDINGESRYQAVVDGLKQDHFVGNVGVQQFGATEGNGLQLPLGKQTPKNFATLNPGLTDPNGNDILNAIPDAANHLQTTVNGKVTSSGEIIIISDDDFSTDEAGLTAIANKLKKKDGISTGITTKVIIPGTQNSSYTYKEGGQQYPSGVNPAVFYGFGVDNITSATTASGIAQAIENDVDSYKPIKHNHLWYPPYAAFGAMMIGSFLIDNEQRVSSWI